MKYRDITVDLPDMHFPFHSVGGLRTCLQAIKHLRPRQVVLGGDLVDCSHFSRHPKQCTAETKHAYLADAIEPLRSYLREIRRWTGRLVWIMGNHDAWVERWLAQALPDSVADDLGTLITPTALLKDEVDEIIPYMAQGIPHYEIAPNLWSVHGWAHSRYAAARHLDMARTRSVVFHHTHRAQSFVTRVPESNEVLQAWSAGGLAIPQQFYHHGAPSDHVLGFSVIYHSKHDPSDWSANTHLIRPSDFRAILDGGHHAYPDYDWSRP